jgi:subtilisin family serine protease
MNLNRLFRSISFPGPSRRPRRSLGLNVIAGLALALGIAGAFPADGAPARPPSTWVAGELLVGLRAGVGSTRAQAIYRAHGATVVDEIGQLRIVHLRVPVPLMDLIERLLARVPEVKFVERNYVFDPVLTPNDPAYGDQWHLPRIQAPQAWDLTQGAPGVVIAIVDSGVDSFHPDLASKLVPGYNTYNNNTITADATGHGTEVAGVAGALTNNAEGVAGVAGQSPIMPIRVTNANGQATSLTIAAGLVWAADHGASVMNLSFEGMAGNATIRTSAEYAYNLGALVVAAAGNCGCDDPTPDNPFILSVAATDETDQLAFFSASGPFVDLSAPGTNILTTAKFGLYFAGSGTSVASPVVAGVAALMFSANPSLTPALVIQLLEDTAVDVGVPGYDPTFGHGRVNAFAAVTAAANYVPPPDTTTPTVSIASPTGGATVSGTAVVDVSATDNVAVVQVDLWLDGALFATDATSPYSFAWDTLVASLGTHTLQAFAVDAAGNVASTTPMTVTVTNVPPDATPPTVAIVAPAAGATVSGTIAVTASASDAVGVVSVDLYVDGALFATDTSAPYTFIWNTGAVSIGAHALYASAVDAAGNRANSTPMTVTVTDTTAPTVAFSAPGSGATVSGTTTVMVSASDNVGVVKVDLYVDNVFYATDTSAPYSFAWNTTTVSLGSHTLKAVARDAAGNTATKTITVTVTTPPNRAPVAVNDSLAAPYRPNISYTAQVFTVLANDSDPDGTLDLTSVRIVKTPNKGGTVIVNANGTVSYTPRRFYRGLETFTYNVKDNRGTTSNTATVTVNVQ